MKRKRRKWIRNNRFFIERLLVKDSVLADLYLDTNDNLYISGGEDYHYLPLVIFSLQSPQKWLDNFPHHTLPLRPS